MKETPEIWRFEVEELFGEFKRRDYVYFSGKPSKSDIEASAPWGYFLRQADWRWKAVADRRSFCDRLLEGLLRDTFAIAWETYGFDLEQIEIREANPQENT